MKLISKQYRPWLIYAGCTLSAVALFTSNLRGGFASQKIESTLLFCMTPFFQTTHWVEEHAKSAWLRYLYLIDLKDENMKLKMELEDARSRLYSLEESAIANERYRELLQFSRRLPRGKIMGDVIRKGNGSWDTILIVSAGQLEGVQSYMGAATADGVVGQVVRTAPRSSKIITFLHPQSGIAAQLQKSRIAGIVTGTGHGTCIFKFASRFRRIVLGETVVTSGLDSVFPEGLPIGQVSKIEKFPGEIFQQVEIIPFVDLSRVEEVVLFFPEVQEPLDD